MVRVLASIFLTLSLATGGGGAAIAQQAAEPHAQGDGPAGMHHSFENAEQWAKEFDDPSRDAWQKPDQVVEALQLAPTAIVADLGAGTGYFSVRLAKRVPQGKVYAVDIEPEMLRHLGERKHQEHLMGLEPVQASADDAHLPEPVDLVLVVDTYHHIDNRTAYFAKLRQSLRPNGRLAIIDFKVDAPEGPPPQFRIPPEQVTAELNAASYSLVASHPFLPRQYFLVFRPLPKP